MPNAVVEPIHPKAMLVMLTKTRSDVWMRAVGRAFEKAGVDFIDENGGGAGVRLRKPRDKDPKKKQRV